MIYTTPKGPNERNNMKLRATTASDGTHDLIDNDGTVVAEYLPDADAIVSFLSPETMYREVRLTVREAWLMEALAPFGTVTPDGQTVIL
jgi:hypothetical protein